MPDQDEVVDPYLEGTVPLNDPSSPLWPDEIPVQSRFGDPRDYRPAQHEVPAEGAEPDVEDEAPKRRGRPPKSEPVAEPAVDVVAEPEVEHSAPPEEAPVVELVIPE